MNPCYSRIRPARYSMMVLAIVLSIAAASVSGALISINISGPTTLMYDSPSNALGNLKLGDPLSATFTYDTDDFYVAGYSDKYRAYVSNSTQIIATIDGANYEFSRMELIMTEKDFTVDGHFADSAQFRAINSTNGVSFDGRLYYNPSTLSRFDMVAPVVSPVRTFVSWSPPGGEFAVAVSEDLSGVFDPPPPVSMSPVPEPSTYGAMGALVLLGVVGARRRMEKQRRKAAISVG